MDSDAAKLDRKLDVKVFHTRNFGSRSHLGERSGRRIDHLRQLSVEREMLHTTIDEVDQRPDIVGHRQAPPFVTITNLVGNLLDSCPPVVIAANAKLVGDQAQSRYVQPQVDKFGIVIFSHPHRVERGRLPHEWSSQVPRRMPVIIIISHSMDDLRKANTMAHREPQPSAID